NKLEIIEVFNIHLFQGFILNHLSSDEIKILYVVFSLVIVMGVIAEEFYFRAYLFTIQFNYFKKTTWLINGLSWSVYHIFPFINILMILPISFVYSYIFQK